MQASLYIHDRLADVTELVRDDKSLIRVVNKWYKELETRTKLQCKIDKVANAGLFGDIPESVYRTFDNASDELFVSLLAFLGKAKLDFNATSLYRMWSRLKGTGNSHIITYLRYSDVPRDRTIYGTDLIELCYKGADGLENFMKSLNPSAVEAHLRELLGCSGTADIKEKFMLWVKDNHPDKGGDYEKFADVNSVYREWKETAL